MVSTDISPPQPLENLYADHHSWLRKWLRGKLGNNFDAADLAHDTYVRIMQSGRIPPADESRRLLAHVANGLVIDLYRRRKIESAYLDTLAQLPPAQVPSEETRALAIEALIEVDAILHRLPPKARTALLLRRLDGLSYADIAQRLKVSVSSVEKYVATGLEACLAAMSDAP